jgi:hypothetical protein
VVTCSAGQVRLRLLDPAMMPHLPNRHKHTSHTAPDMLHNHTWPGTLLHQADCPLELWITPTDVAACLHGLQGNISRALVAAHQARS